MDLSPDEDNFPGRLLHQAALWDNVELLQELIMSGENVNSRDKNNRTALHAAALAERSQCVVALCAAGADVDAVSDKATGGKTALHISSERGYYDNVRNLLKAGADLFITDSNGDTALTAAERGNHMGVVQLVSEAKDALERERLAVHKQLRDMVAKGAAQQLKIRLEVLGSEAALIVNLTPGGASTLLYVASEAGSSSMVQSLLEVGADGRAHPVTKYSPLYIACYRGHLEVAHVLLAHFPQAAQQGTVEKWLPLHAACIGGNHELVSLLLDYPYPESMMNTYTDSRSKRKYRAAFDVNACDVSGQTALYVSSTLGAVKCIEALFSYRVQVLEDEPGPSTETPLSPRSGVSVNIHALVSRLTRHSPKHEPPDRRICPVLSGGEVSGRGEGCVSAAVRGTHVAVVRALLQRGADVNCSALPPSQFNQPTASSERDRRRSRSLSIGRSSASPSPGRNFMDCERDQSPWTPLALAIHNKNTQLADLLLEYGATDTNCKALRECIRHRLDGLLVKILATKAYPDPDMKLNKSTISSTVFNGRGEESKSLTYSGLCPTQPVYVVWRDTRGQLDSIRMSWLSRASLRLNPRVACSKAALHAITRIDISNNDITHLPRELFSMISLRHLNVAQNKLERLPSDTEPFEEDTDLRNPMSKKRKSLTPETKVYTAPVLQDLYLQDNRLCEIPPSLFSLPALQTLDISNNKLHTLPAEMWLAPSLKELLAQLNHLKELPHFTEQRHVPSSPSTPTDGAHQVTSPTSTNTSFNFNKSTSRSPSIDVSVVDDQVDDEVITIGDRTGNCITTPANRIHVWRGPVSDSSPPSPGCPLVSLNVAHNQLTSIPAPLACLAPSLQRLNMAYNCLRSMSYVTSYPTSLRQLDLSHNEISCWPSLPQIHQHPPSSDPLRCYCVHRCAVKPSRPRSGASVRTQLLAAACPARRHLRLESLRTLILANNMLTRIQLTTDDDGSDDVTTDHNAANDDDEWATSSNSLKSKLLFPLLSMLDVSSNLLRSIPPTIHALSNLAVFNISGNKDICELPPQMGLLSRLWNLSAGGCHLSEPLRSMVSGNRCRSVDVVGYLLSVLREARTHSTMKLMIVGLQGIGKTSLLECLRQESAPAHRRKPTEHWAKRMGNKASTRNMSTVGVDIGVWVYEKPRSTRPPITFRSWDFGGQHEYYSTHQYFLSKRSLYLVVWKVTDGKKGLAGAVDWLRSIQARAPGSPVIMVATHYDQVPNSNLPESESPEVLQRLIRTSIMGAPDADKLGLPKVMDSVEVSCSTKHNIRLLADIIYSVAYSIKLPGSKEPLLEQRVPATYLALEECVLDLAASLKEPVLRRDQYRRLVTQYMAQRNLPTLRDSAELHQATMYLHENGILLHYDDATLKELYFLKPQWLCDVLAHVVTVREINPFANNGIMKIDDLAHVFKASPLLARGEEASSLGLSLLNKFELALCWDSRYLLVPPLLPAEEPKTPQVSVRNPRRSARVRREPDLNVMRADSPSLIQEPGISLSSRASGKSIRRLLVLSYVPRGFWPRLCTRLLADDTLADVMQPAYQHELSLDESTSRALTLEWSWSLWRCGVRVVGGGDVTLAAVRELPPVLDDVTAGLAGHAHTLDGLVFRIKCDGAWCPLDIETSSCIEILLPADYVIAKRTDGTTINGYQSITIEPSLEVIAKILALVSDHVDLLLEDWYPSLGTRFVHTSEGRCLITRIVPCPSCLKDPDANDEQQIQQALRRLEVGEIPRRPHLSQESRTSDGDSGVGAESNASSGVCSVEGRLSVTSCKTVYSWTVEQCILAACTNAQLSCPRHLNAHDIRNVAPDVMFLDVEEDKRVRWEHISVGSLVGRGAFGVVRRVGGTGGSGGPWGPVGGNGGAVGGNGGPVGGPGGLPTAIKLLQPVHTSHQTHQHKAAMSRWERDPAGSACRAYCALRQELSILRLCVHPHVLPLWGVCAAPLALLLPLAPMGSLYDVLVSYRAAAAAVGRRAGRGVLLQVARALEYLHTTRVLYRDLKSENVLVWSMPRPQDALTAETLPDINVHVKLGDYGISRLAPPSGTKGFGGTEGFMAPEIMRYNGEEEYNEKVDCFSFGMLIYEIITLRQPFEGHEAIKEAVLEGTRPALTPREVSTPWCLLDTMRRCWCGSPSLRPSAAGLVSVLSAPEVVALQDTALVPPLVAGGVAVTTLDEESDYNWEIWYGSDNGLIHTLTCNTTSFQQINTLRLHSENESVTATSMCRVGDKIWVGDSSGQVSVYCARTLSLSWRVCVSECVGGGRESVSAMCALLPLEEMKRVALALRTGRLFLVSSEMPQAEGSFVLTELGTATQLSCLAVVPTSNGVSVCAGGECISIYGVDGGGVRGAESLRGAGVVGLVAVGGGLVAVYTSPGSIVYQYNVSELSETARLDCAKLAPCSESLQSIDIDEKLGQQGSQVTSMAVLNNELYIGTSWGCLIVVEATTMRPITVFRPYEQNLTAIVPLVNKSSNSKSMIATFGTGYRPLLNRYAPNQFTFSWESETYTEHDNQLSQILSISRESETFTEGENQPSTSQTTPSNAKSTANGTYCLLWNVGIWLPD